MLELKLFMNSTAGEVLAFKCCALPDQNLEIHLRNTGTDPVVLSGFFVLESDGESKQIGNVYPPGEITVPPEDLTAVYCYMDETDWRRYHAIAFSETNGREHRFAIAASAREPGP